jgi:hypothetical protein
MREIFVCSCHSLEHQMAFWHDEDDKYSDLYTEVHLITYYGFFRRLWYGLKYAFGYKSRFGAWDEFLFNKDSEQKLYNYLKEKYNVKEKV